jgi:hypothetical protein
MADAVETIDVKVRAILKVPDPEKPGEEMDWVMGEDLKLTINPKVAFRELAERVRDAKGVPLSRMHYSLPPARQIPNSKWDKNLRMVGIYNNGTVRLEPTTPECSWQWEPIEYHWANLVEAVRLAVDPKDGTHLTELQKNVPLPPPMKGVSLGSFLRK